MSLTFIDTNALPRRAAPAGGTVTEVLNRSLCGAKNVAGALRWLQSGEAFAAAASGKQQLIYVMEGSGVIRLDGKDYDVEKGAGVFLEPSETAEIRAGKGASLKLFHLEVPPIPAN